MNGYQNGNGRRHAPAEGPVTRRTHRLRESPWRYAVASGLVAAATLLVAVMEALVSFPPLLLLAGAIAVSVTTCGVGAGFLAWLLGTLLTDYFFVTPTLTFSLNETVAGLALHYVCGGAVAYFAARRVIANR